MSIRLGAAALCVLWAATSPAWAQSTEVPVEGGKLVLTHPADWKATIGGPAYGPTLKLGPKGPGDFQVIVTAIVSKKELPDDEKLERLVREKGEELLPTATQTSLEIAPVKGSQARGYLYHLTDQNAEKGPGDYRELSQGAIVVPPLLLSVTILTHSGDGETVKSAMSALASARYVGEKP